MADTWTILNSLKTALSSIPDVNTCKIGLEAGLTPDDYPIVRIVPDKIMDGDMMGRTLMSVWVYYGAALTEADEGLEAVYQALSDLQTAIVEKLNAGGDFVSLWKETITDEDRLEHFKIFASRFDVVG